MILFLDIETLPCADPEFIAEVESTITAPAQYKEQESIDKWMEENKDQAVKDAVAKTSFDGMLGSIACICYSFDYGKIYSVDVNTSGSENVMINHFYAHVFQRSTPPYNSGLATTPIVVCGHNVAGFDLPFLKARSIILGAKPIDQILDAMNAKPWESKLIADTMLMWNSSTQNRVSMNKLCKALGIPDKGDFDGSMVAETWPVDPQKVIDYCKDDVIRTREIYKRITFS